MNKKTIYIIVAVIVIIIIVAAAAAFVFLGTGGGPSPTPTPTTTPVSVVGATSLQFTVDETTQTSGGPVQVIYNYATRNFNQSNEELRVDIPASNYSIIVKLADSTSYRSTDNGATWTAGVFNEDVAFASLLNDYVTQLYNWNGHDATYTYTVGDITNVISAIHVNPTLPDSMFTATS
ncbi:MAG: hypothetical protein NWE98_03305 [Candidatus Bathyarchaeota archaeon]|nr:hypothetical protein [Candidatus Bathyarchaeota archaeon]